MSEIVKRIEIYIRRSSGEWGLPIALLQECSDEIQRLTTALENARKDALEEAAKWHVEGAESLKATRQKYDLNPVGAATFDAEIAVHEHAATAIRSLTPPTEKAT